jgi:(2Fe-2S) ferredoxin
MSQDMSEQLTAQLTQQAAPDNKPKIAAYRRHLLVCTGTRCTQDGESQAIFDSLGDKFKAAGLHEGEMRVKRSRVSCFAACKGGPVMCVQPDGVWYYQASGANLDRIINEHLVGGRVVEELVFHQGPGLAESEDDR